MRKAILLSLLASASMAVSATGPLAFDRAPQKVTTNGISFHASPVKQVVSNTKLSKRSSLQVVNVNGFKAKQLMTDDIILPIKSNKAAMRRASESASLYESFEDYDGSATWMPDGWSAVSKDADNENPWFVYNISSYYSGYDGTYTAVIDYSEDYCDEYLITKAVTVQQDEELSFLGLLSPVFMYNLDEDHFDWDSYDYIGEKEVIQTVKVLVSEDNGETWTQLKDYAEYYKSYDFMSLYSLPDWSKYTISLADYVGKTVKFAFEYVGTDGNINGIDAVSVDKPALEVSYSYPYYTQFYGLSKEFAYLPYTLTVEPAFTPLTWTNTSDNENATYSWYYHSPDDDMLTETGYDFTMTYHTDFSSDFSTRNNLYYAPTLTGSAPGAADGTYSRGDYFQVGGKAQFQLRNSDTQETYIEQFGFAPFDMNTEGFSFLYTDLGATPLCGYSATTDDYWTKYSFPDEDDYSDPANYSYVDGIINVFQTSESPLVIHGGWVLAYCADIDEDHEFTFEVCPLTDEGEIADAVASATIKGSDIQTVIEGSNYSYCTLPFEFDEPVSLSSADCDQFIVRLTGIHECGEFFAPFQSTDDNPEGTYHGFLQKVVSWNNNPRTSLTAVVRLFNMNTSFAMMLDAEYPWLQGEEEVSLDENNSASLELNSYYSGEEFSYTAPEWLKVSVSGVNDECVATFTADYAAADATEAEVTLSVPGFDKKVSVKNIKAGVETVKFDSNKEVKNYFNLSGVNLGKQAPTTPGVYVTRYTDGSVNKVVVK